MKDLFYSDPQSIDLQKLRDHAEQLLAGDYRTPPEETVIHFHKHGTQCTPNVHGIKIQHEYYHFEVPEMTNYIILGWGVKGDTAEAR